MLPLRSTFVALTLCACASREASKELPEQLHATTIAGSIESLPPLVTRDSGFPISALSPVADRLALATTKREVILLDITGQSASLRVPPRNHSIADLVWNHDGSILAVVQDTGPIDLVDAASGELLRCLDSRCKKARSVEVGGMTRFLQQGRLLASALGDQRVDVWTVESGDRAIQLAMLPTHIVTAMTVSSDGEWLAVGTDQGAVSVWQVGSWAAPWASYQAPHDKGRMIDALDFDANGRRLAIGVFSDCTARVWNVGADQHTQDFSMCDLTWLLGSGVGHVEFSADGVRLLATTCYGLWELRVWNTETSALLAQCSYDNANEHAMPAWFTPDGDGVLCSIGLVRVPLGTNTITWVSDFKSPAESAEFNVDGDYAWAVVSRHLVIRKLPDEQPILEIAVRDS